MKLVTVEHGVPFGEMIRRADIGRVHPDLDPERMRSWGNDVRRIAVGIVRTRTKFWQRDLWKVLPDRMAFLDLWELLAYVATLCEFRPNWRFAGVGSRAFCGGHGSVPLIELVDGARYLTLYQVRFGWTPGYALSVQGNPEHIAPELLPRT